MRKKSKAYQNYHRLYGDKAMELYLADPTRTVRDVHALLTADGLTITLGTIYRWAGRDRWDDVRNKRKVDGDALRAGLLTMLDDPKTPAQKLHAAARLLDRVDDEAAADEIPRIDPDATPIQQIEAVREYYLGRANGDGNENLAQVRLEIVAKCDNILRARRDYAERVAEEVLGYIEEYAADNDMPLLREYVAKVEPLAHAVALRLGGSELKR